MNRIAFPDYQEMSIYLHDMLRDNGYHLDTSIANEVYLCKLDGAEVAESDVDVVKGLISNFDPLPDAINQALRDIKAAVSARRNEFVTANKDTEYQQKRAAITDYRNSGVVSGYVAERIALTGETVAAVIGEWELKAALALVPVQKLAAIEDYARSELGKRTDWQAFPQFVMEILAMIEAVDVAV